MTVRACAPSYMEVDKRTSKNRMVERQLKQNATPLSVGTGIMGYVVQIDVFRPVFVSLPNEVPNESLGRGR